MSVWDKAGISRASGVVLTFSKLCGQEGAHNGNEHGEGWKRNGLKPGTALQNKVEQHLKMPVRVSKLRQPKAEIA